jgi:hypothetical protein
MSWARRAALAAAVAAAAAIGIAPPAFAATVSGSLNTPADGSTASTAPAITGSFRWEGGIDTISLSVVGETGQPGTSVSGTCDNPPEGVSCSEGGRAVAIEWTPVLTQNGRYSARATVSGKQGQNGNRPDPAQSIRSFQLSAPPAPPRGVRADVAEDRSVTVSWRANTETDMLGYVVYRSFGGAGARAVGEIPHGTRSTYSYTDANTSKAGGPYQYHVIATRDDGSGGGVSSEPSTEVTAQVPEPPATTTTSVPTSPTTRPGGGGGGTPTTTPASGGGGGTVRPGGVDLSDFRGLVSRGELPAQPPPTLPDTGFNPTLDYGDRELPEDQELGEDEPGLALPDLVSDGFDGRRPTLVLIASGLVLFVFAMHLRLLARRVEPIEKPLF